MNLPQARTDEIVEQELNGELLIYDLAVHKAYTLNETSKIIFKACDGKTSFSDLKRKYKYTDDLIYLALDELRRNDLMEGDYRSPLAGIGRREVIKRVGLATMVALPLIASITAPQAIRAASNDPCPGCCDEVECPYAQSACENDGVCDPATGNCIKSFRPAGTPCDDNNARTINDVCDGAGNCVGTSV